jgi:hypothetical protein
LFSWGRDIDVTASDPNPSFDLKMRRRTIYTQIHQMITLYNTTISKSKKLKQRLNSSQRRTRRRKKESKPKID